MRIEIEAHGAVSTKTIDHDDLVFDEFMDHLKDVVMCAGWSSQLWDEYFSEESAVKESK